MFKRNRARRIQSDQLRNLQLQAFLDDARSFYGVEGAEVPGMHLPVGAEERVYLCVPRVSLFESHPEPDIDLTREEVTPTDATVVPTAIDRGELAITSARAVFTGTKQIRIWLWQHLVAIDHADRDAWTRIAVSNRRRTFGVLYDPDNQEQIRFSLELAAATAEGSRAALIERLTSEMAARSATSGPESH